MASSGAGKMHLRNDMQGSTRSRRCPLGDGSLLFLETSHPFPATSPSNGGSNVNAHPGECGRQGSKDSVALLRKKPGPRVAGNCCNSRIFGLLAIQRCQSCSGYCNINLHLSKQHSVHLTLKSRCDFTVSLKSIVIASHARNSSFERTEHLRPKR